MPFVLFLFFGFIFWICCVNDKAKHYSIVDAWNADHPPRDFQEMYLEAFKIYREYRKDPSRIDPAGDAEIEVERRMYGVKNPRLTDLHERRLIRKTYLSYKELLRCRERDKTYERGALRRIACQVPVVLPSAPYEQRKQYLNAIEELERQYNEEMDRKWWELYTTIWYEDVVQRQNRPMALADEYLTACGYMQLQQYNDNAIVRRLEQLTAEGVVPDYHPENRQDPRWRAIQYARYHSLTEVPSSWKVPWGPCGTDDFKYYSPSYTVDQRILSQLLQCDYQSWICNGIPRQACDDYVNYIEIYKMHLENGLFISSDEWNRSISDAQFRPRPQIPVPLITGYLNRQNSIVPWEKPPFHYFDRRRPILICPTICALNSPQSQNSKYDLISQQYKDYFYI